jgi:hypothetical protein
VSRAGRVTEEERKEKREREKEKGTGSKTSPKPAGSKATMKPFILYHEASTRTKKDCVLIFNIIEQDVNGNGVQNEQ